jgi:hypothetical protein
MIGFARQALGLPSSAMMRLSPLGGRGSDRAYFRLEWTDSETAILVHYDPKRVENAYHADIAGFLAGAGVPVPGVIRHDPDACMILMEDLGDTDLWSFREAPWDTRGGLYRKTLSVAHRLHSFPLPDFPSERVRLMEPFGPDLYRWERDYFREHFVEGICAVAMEPSVELELETELAGLAERLAATSPCLVHRDLQSQNVMIKQGEPVLIDFQGMRRGSAFYDLASLLCDPYARLFGRPARRTSLLIIRVVGEWRPGHLHGPLLGGLGPAPHAGLGAYGFLGRKRGLDAFLAHIRRASTTLSARRNAPLRSPYCGSWPDAVGRASGNWNKNVLNY